MKLASKGAAYFALTALSACAGLSGCNDNNNPSFDQALRDKVKNVVVIYAENRSFDSLFGKLPNVNGLGAVLNADGTPTAAYVKQKDRDGAELAKLPQTWGGVTAAGNAQTVTQAQSDNLPNAPFAIETAFKTASGVTLTTADVTRDFVHRFFNEQMQLNGGKMDSYAAWSDAGGLTMGHFDYSGSKLVALAQQYVIADNWFNGAFGGSFLNHQYLICACAPTFGDAETRAASRIATVDKDSSGNYTAHLTVSGSSPASALSGPPVFTNDGAIAPKDYFGAGDGYRGINTLQPAFQPSGNTPATASAADLPYANMANSSTLPQQTQTNIGDLLTGKGVNWTWYAGAWNAALADGTQDPSVKRTVIYTPSTPRGSPDFQPHHQPFNYYAEFDPATHAADRTAHLKDETDLLADAAGGKLPAVAFYKPQGNYNQHPGYANLDDGDSHIADLVAKLQASPQWNNMVIIITYDEFGGQWDHVAPPKGDKLGPGTRLPAIIISPFAKKGTVDHTQYDTGSILRFISRVYDLDSTKLPGLKQRDDALKANGGQAMGDLTAALSIQ
jgi:acid phosphatase